MKILLIILAGIAALGGMWWYIARRRAADDESKVTVPIVPQTQDPRQATGTKGAACAVGAIAGAAASGSFGVPPPVGGAIGCAIAPAIQGFGEKAWNALTPWDTNTVNCSVAQQPGNAKYCRDKYGLASAPGSDAWAFSRGQSPLLSGPGSS